MARGNQRDKAREKNLAEKLKNDKKKTVLGKGGLLAKREADAAKMRAKQDLANQKKEAEALAAKKK